MKLTHERSLSEYVESALPEKMAFIGGPRQVGKTTLSRYLAKAIVRGEGAASSYLNWDVNQDRTVLLKGQLDSRARVFVFDEIHKYARWRNLVKGFYDSAEKKRSFIITGSAQLDYYRKGGDSLQGRYRYFRLHPFSVNELGIQNSSDLKMLMKFGGFPEPLSKQDETAWRLWQRDRTDRVVFDDIRDLESVKEISLIEELALILPSRVGSILSLNSLKEDLQVSHASVDRWISILERLYYCFRIPPHGSPRIRAIKKEQKLYFWDWSACESQGQVFENLVASQLLKYCHFLEDTEGFRMELRFLRDKEGREVDFVVLKDKKPVFAVECKTGERSVSKAISYFKERTLIPEFYQVHLGTRDFEDKKIGVRILPFATFCRELKMP